MNRSSFESDGGENMYSNMDKRTHFREALLIGAQLHLEDRLRKDAELRHMFLDDPHMPKVDQFVKMSFTNALSTVSDVPEVIDIRELIDEPLVAYDVSDHQDVMQTTLTTCLTNPSVAAMTRFSKKKYHEKLYIHIPYNGLTIPREIEDIETLPEPSVVFLEYRKPKLSKNKTHVSVETVRYAVTPVQIAPYASYESGEIQQDEFDLLAMSNPDEFIKKYLGDIAASSTAMRAIEVWHETPLAQLRRDIDQKNSVQ